MSNNSFRIFAVIFICGLIGITLAFITLELYTQGIVVDEYVSGSITIENLMSIIIIIWLMIGVVLGVAFS